MAGCRRSFRERYRTLASPELSLLRKSPGRLAPARQQRSAAKPQPKPQAEGRGSRAGETCAGRPNPR
jgi:hypothetical protein